MSETVSDIPSVLLVEDNQADAKLVQERLKDISHISPFHLTHVPTLLKALDIIQRTTFHAILLDLNLPEANGLDTLNRIRAANSSIPIVVLTVTDDEPLALEAIKLGAQDYIPKSQMSAVLLSRVLHYAIEREKNERIRHDSERKYRLFVEGATGLAFILLDLEGHIIHWNSGAQQLFGYPEEAALGKYFSFLFPSQDQSAGRPEMEIQRAIANDKGDDDNWLVRADGTRFWASGAVTAVRDAQDQLIGFAKVIRDKTVQKDARDSLAELNRTLEDRVRQRTEEVVRHRERLRAMASDLILTEQRERRRLASDLHDYLAQLLVVCRLKLNAGQPPTDAQDLGNMIREVDAILDQSLTYTRTMVSQLSPTCLYEFGLHAALVWLGTEMDNQGLKVKLEGGNQAVELPEDQAVLVYQSVRELLYNVLKHSGVHEAHVKLSVQDRHLDIEVQDHGCGFSENHDDRDESSSTKFGLFSIRERLEALGGEIVVTSALEQGTHVLMRVPLETNLHKHMSPRESMKHIPRTKTASHSPTTSDKIRILLVDDHKMVREGFCHLLNGEWDIEVVGEAEEGQHALSLCDSLRPDVIVMDYHMPNMDGMEATRRIKREFPHIGIIGLSVYDSPDVARLFEKAGASAFLTKGGPAEVLVNTIRQVARPPSVKREKP